MKSVFRFLLQAIASLALAGVAFSQTDHVLITEFVVTPTAGEFIEILNPTESAVDLTNYYLTDDVDHNNNDYVRVVNGVDSVSLGVQDFLVKFPDGAQIGGRQTLVVAFSGSGFQTTYGRTADYEILGLDASVPDMVVIDATTNAGLSNAGEAIILFAWDGASDLVQDVDYVVWGDKEEAIDKSGWSIDGPDADSTASSYANDTPVANQTVVNPDDADEQPHDLNKSASRTNFEAGETLTGGNGINGHDETSENLSIAGGSWTGHATPTPGTVPGVLRGEQPLYFMATLDGAQEVPAVDVPAVGGAFFAINPDRTELTFNIALTGLSGAITAAHFHNAAAGLSGDPVRTITADFSGEAASGVWKNTDAQPLTEALVAELLVGNIYVNVHTAAHPTGEVRGQMLAATEKKFAAALNGAQENPPVTTSASGFGIFSLKAAGTELQFDVKVNDLSGAILAAHFHNAAVGVNGGVVRSLLEHFEGTYASGTWSSTDAQALTPALVAELLAGKIYVNVHTAANPGGELRGQVEDDVEVVFFATLGGNQEVPAVSASGVGGGMFVLNPDQDQLAFNVSVTGLSGAIASAHFHQAEAGANGPVVRTITGDFTGEEASGVWRSTDAEPLTTGLVRALIAGSLYVNVHTAANPSGEIRGQFLAGREQKLGARLSGDQEVPPVTTTANGVGSFVLNPTGTELSFDVTVNDLSGPINAAHFHNAAAGINGAVVRTITNDFIGNTAIGAWKEEDNDELSPLLVAELLATKIYVNVHTSANPGGEIRGQIEPRAEVVFLAVLNGDQEMPAVETGASGGGRFVLNEDKTELAFEIKVCNLSGPIANAHFHNAAAGTNGSVVRTLTADFTDTTAVGVWRNSDAEPLTASLVAELLAGNIYVNVHTAAHPSGEIRGQLTTGVPVKFAAQLEGSQEVPPVTTDAAGFGSFVLNPTGTELAFTAGVIGLSGPMAAAHFHNATAGKNGPVVRTITNDFSGNLASGVWRNTDAEPLTSSLAVELLAGKIYVNVHTAANPGGEVRGQVVPGAQAIVPIGLAREIADGTTDVSIAGIITTTDFQLSSASNSEFYLQDATGGIRMFATSGKVTLERGVRVRATGTVATNSGRKNLETTVTAIAVVDTPGVPAPQVVTVDFYLNNRAALEGEHIRINDANLIGSFPAANSNGTVTINDGTGELAMFIDRDTDIDGSTQPPNPVDVIGVATSFNSVPQIQPSFRADILSTTTFFATLSGEQEVPPVTTSATGGGMFMLNPDQTELSFNIRVQGLSGAITGAHFHNAAAGVNGVVVRALTADFAGEVASGVWKNTDTEPLTPALVSELLAGNMYVNVHTATNPAGEIRGQVLVGAPSNFSASMSGDQEVPPVTTTATGTGAFSLNATGTELAFNVTVSGLSGDIVSAHFHNAPAGANGAVVRTITSDFVGNTASGTWKSTDAEALTPALVAELLAGTLYVNVHTATNPSGEIRGQITRGAETIFLAVLNGEQEVPAVSTSASGGGRFVLNADQTELAFEIKVCNLSGPIAAAHFHNAALGVNGGVVHTITTDFTDTTAVGVWSSTGGEPLTTALVAQLLAGNIYANVHTAANAGGEIRGQVLTGVAVDLAAQLEGDQEVPAVSTEAAGFGKLTLRPDGKELTFNAGATGLSGAIAAAHFHNADRGKNGPVVRTITGDFTNNIAAGVWRETDSEPLTSSLVVELLAGQIYLNVHTAANPGGEIRGQVIPGAEAVVPIGVARQLADGTADVALEGLVTTVDFRLSSGTSSEYYIQDETGGLRVFVFGGKAALAQGELVRVVGLIGTNAGRKNIEVDAANIDSLATPGLPQPRLVTVAEYLANQPQIEGQYIRIENASINGSFPAEGSDAPLSINDGTGDLAMFIDRDTNIDGSAQPPSPVHILGVATSFNGVAQIQPSSADDFIPATAVDDKDDNLPTEFHLAQNYPNPFNPSTIIRYDLPKPVHVKLVIYDLRGTRVRVLVDAQENAGFKQAQWDGSSESGARVASGVYFYRMEAGSFVASRKLLLTK